MSVSTLHINHHLKSTFIFVFLFVKINGNKEAAQGQFG